MEESVSPENNFLSRQEVLIQPNPSYTFSELSSQNQLEIWVDKLHQLEKLALPDYLLVQIESALAELEVQEKSGLFLMTPNLAEITKELLRIVPEQDFIYMFVSLEEYSWKGDFEGTQFCSTCIGKVEVQGADATSSRFKDNSNQGEEVEEKPACDCNWGCDWYVTVNGGSSCKGCEPTESGCGPFGRSGCYRDYEADGEC